MFYIPEIDMSKPYDELRQDVITACRKVGFLTLINHDIDFKNLHYLSKSFFNLPLKDKMLLNKKGYFPSTVNGKEGLETALRIRPDLILLDVMMPVLDGMETCTLLRKEPSLSKCIIAFLTARGGDYSELAGFNLGADDYITKPVKPQVLVSRIKAMLRRIKGPQPLEEIEKHGISVDRDRYMVLQHGNEITLPKKEFELEVASFRTAATVFQESGG